VPGGGDRKKGEGTGGKIIVRKERKFRAPGKRVCMTSIELNGWGAITLRARKKKRKNFKEGSSSRRKSLYGEGKLGVSFRKKDH